MKPIWRWLRSPKTGLKANLWETSADMQQICKFHRGIEPRTFLLWDNSAKHCTITIIIISQFIALSKFLAFGALLEMQLKRATNQNYFDTICCYVHSYVCSLQQSVWSTIDMPFPAITHQLSPFGGQTFFKAFPETFTSLL